MTQKPVAQPNPSENSPLPPSQALGPVSTVSILVKPRGFPLGSVGKSFIWIALMAAIWGVLTHLAIVHVINQLPIIASRPVLQQVEPLVENAFHAIAAWERLEADEELSQDRTLSQQFGHFPYAEIAPEQLMIIGSYTSFNEQRFERMQDDAALALLQLIDSARRDGVWIVPISGFRDYHRQHMLFQLQTAQANGVEEWAARTVAPPGYSEHHTGLAVDLADGMARAMDLSLAFGDTEAFQWLSQHAHEFGYELSFPVDNAQGVSYEPWHWRFIGSAAAQFTFAQRRGPGIQIRNTASPGTNYNDGTDWKTQGQ